MCRCRCRCVWKVEHEHEFEFEFDFESEFHLVPFLLSYKQIADELLEKGNTINDWIDVCELHARQKQTRNDHEINRAA